MEFDPVVVAISAGGALLAGLVVLFVMAGGSPARLGLALQALRGGQAGPPAETKPVAPAKPSGAPLRFLTLLQREGRLLDFLLEDVQAYQDAQIGAAVRDIHRQCQSALKEHLLLEPVLAQEEGSEVQVPPGFDASAIRLTGNVTGQPPFRGKLMHHGWRAKQIKLAPPPEGQDEFVIMPAEVELA